MIEDPILVLAVVVFLGVLAQWLAWRVRLPSILLLLLAGVFVGPATRFLDPDALFGTILTPLVSISVAVILYDGGLSLKLRELRSVGGVVWSLVSLGALVTWAGGTLGARAFLGLDWPLSVLLGAILVVTGPTVILPLLMQIRPSGASGSILKWEGIVIDPVGALLAVLVFEAVSSDRLEGLTGHAALAVAKTLAAGGGLGIAGAALLAFFLRRYWIPDYLQNPISLTTAVFVYACANLVQEEAGLFAVTLMGILLANQPFVEVEHIIEFKENLRVLLISMLFVVLGARIRLEDIASLGWGAFFLVVLLIVVVRPLAVLLSSVRSDLHWREKALLAWMAPRGIVAASVASIFAMRLAEDGHRQAPAIVAATFAVIIGTVSFYGLTAPLAARRLGLAVRDPQGILIVGAGPFCRATAATLQGQGIRVLLVDRNRRLVREALMAGLAARQGNILSDASVEETDLGGIGRLMAMTPNDWTNSKAATRFSRLFGRASTFMLVPTSIQGDDEADVPLSGRGLFAADATWPVLDNRLRAGWAVKATPLSEEFGLEEFRLRHGEGALPLFVVPEEGKATVVTAEDPPEPEAGQTLVALVPPEDKPSL